VSRLAPIRTCVGCGERAPQGVLLRVVATPAGLRADPLRRVPGRGAYLHGTPACRAAFARRRGPVRSLALTVPRGERERFVAALAAAGSCEGHEVAP
jgi:predicted RNA-binding protein YlxR (DUF448 family)